jgi:CMP/dCMP kinase
MTTRSIVVNGDLGSGKSTVSKAIAQRLGIRRISVGDMYRSIAQERGMSALELNLHSEIDNDVDAYIDQLQADIAKTHEQLVVDSRLAWFFFSDAFKVHLITDPAVAAQRVLARPGDDVETYSSAREAEESLRRRSESERVRFLRKYGADKARLRNYDIIVDTTRAGPDEAADEIVRAYKSPGGFGGSSPRASTAIASEAPPGRSPFLLLDPARVYPSTSISDLRGLWDSDADFVSSVGGSGLRALSPLTVAYTGTYFYVVDGHRRLSAALQNDFPLVPGFLLAERDELVVGDLDAREYFESEVTLKNLYDWEATHGTRLPVPPHLAGSAQGMAADYDGHGRR